MLGGMVTDWSAYRSKLIDSNVARVGNFAVDERNCISQMGGGCVSEKIGRRVACSSAGDKENHVIGMAVPGFSGYLL